MSHLFEPITLRGTTVRNRIWVSPMCQYSSENGFPTDWHLVHLGQFATGGAGLVFTEATAVTEDGRISPQDAGIWNDDQAQAYRRITSFIHSHGATPGIQLSHAGRKASTYRPWDGRGSIPLTEGGWPTAAPSALAFPGYDTPTELSVDDIAGIVTAFAQAAERAVDAGFRVIELHAAHGYLLHEFLSPLSNVRTDGYGGDLAGRSRMVLETVDAVRAAIGPDVPLVLRVSGTDWVTDGLTVGEVVSLANEAASRGVDLIDVSSGGNVAQAPIPVGPGYQVPLARAVREGAGIPTGAVGLITEPAQAEGVLVDGAADVVLLARALLAEPHWPLRAARELGVTDEQSALWPVQYERAR